MPGSCVGCRYLYGDGDGYSNYTWMNTYIRCALDRNPNLKGKNIDRPEDWVVSPLRDDDYISPVDNWGMTAGTRCDRYQPGPFITLDVDREDYKGENHDPEQLRVILTHAGEAEY